MRRLSFIAALLMAATLGGVVPKAIAGGPKYVAGVNYFNPGTAGTPLTWAQGQVNYYTDQGDLSPILPGPNADAFVADAFSQLQCEPADQCAQATKQQCFRTAQEVVTPSDRRGHRLMTFGKVAASRKSDSSLETVPKRYNTERCNP